MTRSSTWGRLARWVLLACTLVGLAAMHSLGHDGGSHAAAMLSTAAHPADMSADGCAGDGCTHLAPAPPPGHDLPGWAVCLAIVGSLATLVLLAVAIAATARGRGPAAVLPHRAAIGPRAPPAAHRWVGLSLATASVLRR